MVSFTGIRQMLSCNHIRSYQYFTESINPGPCQFIGTECNSWEEFKNGTCFECVNGKKCPFQTKFGLHADSYIRKGAAYGSPLRIPPPRTHVKLYMRTGKEGPFCRKYIFSLLFLCCYCRAFLYCQFSESGFIS